MRILQTVLLLAIIFTAEVSTASGSIFAQTPTPTLTPTPSSETPTPTPSSEKLDDLRKKINELSSKVTELQSQGKTLSSQISVMDNQIKLTQYRIDATQQEIKELTDDISAAENRISNLEGSLDDITQTMVNRIVATYQLGNVQPLQLLLSSQNFTDFIARANYVRIVQANDKKLIYNTVQARNDYENQKEIFEGKKQKVLSLQTQLEEYTEQLDNDKKAKSELLKSTQNDEKKYQELLSKARAEQAAILKIVGGGGNAVSAGPVNKGGVVGYVISGVSACSSGTHLHFEVNKSGIVDPASLLSNRSIIWDNSPDGQFSFGGSWDWPLHDPVRITQGYGMTHWAKNGWYGGGPHTGIDMVSESSLAVRAVESGTLFHGGIACGGGTLSFSRVDHPDGTQSFYLHIVP